MQLDHHWFVFALVLPIALLQWWATREIHRKRLAALQARHVKAQQSADVLLQQSRQQNTQLQLELAAARLAVKRLPRGEPSAPRPNPPSRDTLMRILDEAPAARHRPPPDGFAETMPSMQFPHGSAFGAL